MNINDLYPFLPVYSALCRKPYSSVYAETKYTPRIPRSGFVQLAIIISFPGLFVLGL